MLALRVRWLPATAALLIAASLLAAGGCSRSDDVIVASGTTLQDSGLLDALVPLFERETGFDVKLVPVGTGQALEMGRRGDADVLFTHDPDAEEAYVADGEAINRRLVMHNDFIIVGPVDDPAGVEAARDAVAALAAIAAARAPFISRGDDSGTHRRELELWAAAGIDPQGEGWYEKSGLGMGTTLQIGGQRDAYVLSDRGTFLSQSRNLDLLVLFESDERLLNIYHVMQVNPERHDVNDKGAAAFVDFMVSDRVQEIIRDFGVEQYGQPLFLPDARKTGSESNP